VKLLWLSPRWPFPADDGAKQASHALLEALAVAGHEIDIVTFSRDAELLPTGSSGIRLLAHYRAESQSILSKILGAVRNLGQAIPVSAAPFARFGLNWEKLRALADEEPRAVVIDGAHVFSSFVGTNCPWPLLYRAHNREASLWEQATGLAAPHLRPYFGMQARRMAALEADLCTRSKGIAAISPDDARDFQARFARTKTEWVPMGFHFSAPPPHSASPMTFGFLGRLDWPPNREGLAWLLREVWPQVRAQRPDARLLVAGSGEVGALHAKMGEGVEWRGRIPSVEPFYREIHAAMAPIFFGSGTKIKLVEAARFGRASFATPESLKGSGLSHDCAALVSQDPAAWIRAMVACDAPWLKKVGDQAFTEASQAFDSAKAADRFLSLLS
jgi:glycosyltransferase involved in cell wall biosynthesis